MLIGIAPLCLCCNNSILSCVLQGRSWFRLRIKLNNLAVKSMQRNASGRMLQNQLHSFRMQEPNTPAILVQKKRSANAGIVGENITPGEGIRFMAVLAARQRYFRFFGKRQFSAIPIRKLAFCLPCSGNQNWFPALLAPRIICRYSGDSILYGGDDGGKVFRQSQHRIGKRQPFIP